jgi:hypothetical protein
MNNRDGTLPRTAPALYSPSESPNGPVQLVTFGDQKRDDVVCGH